MSGLAARLGLRRAAVRLYTSRPARPPSPRIVPPPEPGQPPAGLYSVGLTERWPDPYGPDPVVFGREPRVRPTD